MPGIDLVPRIGQHSAERVLEVQQRRRASVGHKDGNNSTPAIPGIEVQLDVADASRQAGHELFAADKLFMECAPKAVSAQGIAALLAAARTVYIDLRQELKFRIATKH